MIAVVPAFDAEASVSDVVRELARRWPEQDGVPPVLVIDDGSGDRTAERARAAGARVISHDNNRGKGAALKTGLREAARLGAELAVSVDADGQHLPAEALRVALAPAPADALVLGVRDLAGAGAPRANQFSNAFSNAFLSGFSRRRLHDTQCGLRRYPIGKTLELGARANGYAFESEVVLRAARSGWTITEVPVHVVYPIDGTHVSHFHSVKDPTRITLNVLWTVFTTRRVR
jgi:glycosyltransferase involved in cell wall biosynthesis